MPDEPLVSIIIPVWRDDVALEHTLDSLPRTDADRGELCDIIVACVLGEAGLYERLRRRHPHVRWISAPRGRAAQMNAGAAAARGRWLLFLHADSRLPADWPDVIARAEKSTSVGGAFRLALDSRDWRARLIEVGVRLRVALLGLPYGDQALFVRREVFDAIGGYRDLPLMEDVDFVRRLKRTGRLSHCANRVVTSARRWQRDGWFRRSAQNAGLAARFMLGASPARLAQRYFGRQRAAIVLMARAPWTPGKTRLVVAADAADHAEIRHALFLDTLDVVSSVRGVEHVVACEPADACQQMRDLVGPAMDVVAQRGRDLGERLTHAVEDVFRLGIESVVVVGSDLPDLPPERLHRCVALLRGRRDRVVLGPAGDGGYYLIGMNRPHPELFERIDWSTERVMAQTIASAKAHGVQIRLLPEWRDVDEASDLERVLTRAAASTARRTRAWVARVTPLQRFDAAATHVSTSASNGPPRAR